MEVKSKLSAQWWWFDSQTNSTPKKSPWLHSTLAELDEKTEAMLKLIEEDADSFAKRAEMYYKKRPELITIVEDLYRAHRSLAEKYDQVKFESGHRHLTPWTSCPSPLSKFRTSLLKESEKSYDSYSESCDFDHDYYYSDDSVVIDDLEQQLQQEEQEEQEEQEADKGFLFDEQTKQHKHLDEEMMTLREEINKLREENKIHKEQLIQKDEEKKEAIRQLSFCVDFLKQENLNLKSRVAKESFKKQTTSSSPFEFTKLKGVFWGKFFNIEATTAVPL